MYPGPIEVSFVMVLLIVEKVSLRSSGSKSPQMLWLIEEKLFSTSLYRGEYGDLGGAFQLTEIWQATGLRIYRRRDRNLYTRC